MKMRIIVTALSVGVAAQLIGAWAFVAPGRAPLPNFDVRKPAVTAASTSRAATPANQTAALAHLQELVPNVTVSRDVTIGMPRLVTSSSGFLTGPDGHGGAISEASLAGVAVSDPHAAIKAFLNEHAALFGHDASIINTATIKRDYVTAQSGMHTVIWEQNFQNIPVFEALLQAHLTKRGELIRISDQFVPSLEPAAANGTPNWASILSNPPVTAAQAVAAAAASAEAPVDQSQVVASDAADGATLKQQFTAPSIKGVARVSLVWLPMNAGTLRLCWDVILMSAPRNEEFRLVVDAQTAQVLVRHCLTFYQAAPTPVPASFNVYTRESPTPFMPGWPTPNTGQPAEVPRTLLTNVTGLSLTGSPAGWVDPPFQGVFSSTGNNVDAYTDHTGNDTPDLPRLRVQSNPPVYDFPLDLTQGPFGYADAAVVQLFYLNNFMHDRLYDLGFTEAAGNFQNNNFNRGGVGGDGVLAQAQDGSGFNNANFSTPPDGISGLMRMYVFDGPNPNRDGDLDATVVCHEYTHGLSNRLVGGGVGIFELQPAGMGEGWSDFYAMSLIAPEGSDPHAVYPAGGYSTYLIGGSGMLENYYYGIRRYPYCTDMTKNPLTFKDIDPSQASAHVGVPTSPVFGGGPADEVHDQGEVWCNTLWEARANCIDSLGYDDGTRVILQAVTDGMKLSPANPTFVEARDAIIQAELVDNGGANHSDLWFAFAKHGLGASASAPTADTTVGVVEAYDVPPDVKPSVADGILEVSVTPADGTTLLAGSTNKIFVRVRDGRGVTNATVVASNSFSLPMTFANDGRGPDALARDSVYSGILVVPLSVPDDGTNMSFTINITAPGKTNFTQTYSYFFATIPSNDNFAQALKVPTAGYPDQNDPFLANNRFASKEPGEPVHAGASSEGNTLWWSWTPAANAPTLVDTAGSGFQTVVAVYVGNALSQLKQVAAVSSVPQRKQSYLTFNATNGVTYRIVVASVNTNNAGPIHLLIAPNGQPDITPPVVSITNLVSGSVVYTRTLNVGGSAVDPPPLPSGVASVNARVGPVPYALASLAAALPSSPTNFLLSVALSPGRNSIVVSATDIAGNVSPGTVLQVRFFSQDPPNDYFNNVVGNPSFALDPTAGTNSVSNANATTEPGEPHHAGRVGGHSVWWSFKAPTDGVLLLTTEGSTAASGGDLDTVLALYTGTRVDALTEVGSNDDARPGSSFSKLAHAVRGGVTYYIAVDSLAGSVGNIILSSAFTPTPTYHVTLDASAGGQVDPAPGQFDVAANSSVTFTATPAPGYDFTGWSGSVSSLANPLAVTISSDTHVHANFTLRPVFGDGFESGNLTSLGWRVGGDQPWFVTTNTASSGNFSARSGAITNNQTSSLFLTTAFAGGTASFDYRVSSELGWDFFGFYLDGTLVQRWSGEVPWSTFGFNLSAGTHTLEWRYSKDPANYSGLDAVFIDNLVVPLASATLTAVATSTGAIELKAHGALNQTFVFQAAPSLPPQWVSISTNSQGTGSAILVDQPTAARTNRFYRLLIK